MVNQETLSLLNQLKQTQGKVSGAVLARQLGISRVALWKRVEALRAAGYSVAADRGGYQLLPGDKPLPWEFPGDEGTLVHFETLGSTMDEAFRLAQQGVTSGAVVAEKQSAGRGRGGRVWESSGGDLLVTLILRPPLPLSLIGALGLEALASLADTLASLYGLMLTIKWPNDLMAGSRKVAGVLVEACGPADRPLFYTVGLGLNVHGLPSLDRPVASMEALGHPEADRRAILTDWRRRLHGWTASPVLSPGRWAALAPPVFTSVETFDGRTASGYSQGFDKSGSLLVAQADEIIPIRYGESRTLGVAL